MTDTVDESESPSLAVIESNTYLTEHIADHISATLCARGPSTKNRLCAIFPPTNIIRNGSLPRPGRHSRVRPDLTAANIGTKSAADVAVYLSLLNEGATRANDNNKASNSSISTTVGCNHILPRCSACCAGEPVRHAYLR
jgi:hypothetical protein